MKSVRLDVNVTARESNGTQSATKNKLRSVKQEYYKKVTTDRSSPVLPLTKSKGGHRLGINGLAVDKAQSILYSGGRDGVVCAWNLDFDLEATNSIGEVGEDGPAASTTPKASSPTTFLQQIQAHTHWINDIALACKGEAVISASSDSSVKIWRPHADFGTAPQALGLHHDYVKCLAVPKDSNTWVASGGLDKKVYLWDLNGGGERLCIDVAADENAAKGSVYALGVGGSILASGGPDNTVRIWDPRSGRRITKFVGHTDNIRDVLVNDDGDTVMTASSDSTVKVWSMTAGRCMNTLTMHSDSVWCLHSDHPRLEVFYSSDRSGVVAKTDVRNCADMDEGLSVAVCQEHEGVNTTVNAGDFIWTATSNSSINRWRDVDTGAGVQVPESYKAYRSSISSRSTHTHMSPPRAQFWSGAAQAKIPLKSVLRISNTALFPHTYPRDVESISYHPGLHVRKPSENPTDTEVSFAPFRSIPEESIEGQNGLIKHVMLNDRRRVLTVDTAGEVMLWDLIKCLPVKSFGKRHLDELTKEINPMASVPNWCSVDTRTGSLTCVLEENYCFDAEVYIDELDLSDNFEFREDQRINLGKWILRYLFSDLIDEEIKRDEVYRQQLLSNKAQHLGRHNAPQNIVIPRANLNGWQENSLAVTIPTTPRAVNDAQPVPATPGLSIYAASPLISRTNRPMHSSHQLTTNAQDGPPTTNRLSTQSQPRSSLDRSADYFSVKPDARSPITPGVESVKMPVTPEATEAPQSPVDGDRDTPLEKNNSLFAKKFRMSFNARKLIRLSTSEGSKPIVEKAEDSDSRSSKDEEVVFESNLQGAIQRIRQGYENELQAQPFQLASAITPSLPNETPVLRPPTSTVVLIQEEQPGSGGVVDLFEGTVGSLGQSADLLERVAPGWLGDALLRNQLPAKDVVKVSFILDPYEGLLPSIASGEGTNRLNANRMLRAKKVLSYVAERIEPPLEPEDPNPMRPEDYLELYCQNQLIPPNMTLAAVRAHIWRGGGDIVFLYKANGRRPIRIFPRNEHPQADARVAVAA